MYGKLNKASDALKSVFGEIDYAIITGTGIEIEMDCEDRKILSYKDVPNMPKPTTPSHKGYFLNCKKKGKNIVVACGRFHYYEEYSLDEVVFLPRILGLSGAKLVILTNAAGGLNPHFKKGDLMVSKDHINMTGANPLRGKNIEELGEKFPDMSRPYDEKYIDMLKDTALRLGIELKEGVYVGVSGPSMETPAETRMFRLMGADAIGMSTVFEVIALRHMNVPCMSVSIITNINRPDCMEKAPLVSVIETAAKASKKLTILIDKFLEAL